MRKSRLLVPAALCAVVVALALGATACNPVTPYAAIVNGTVISTGDVQTEMQGIDASQIFRQTVIGQRLPINGTASGSYSTQFAAAVLTLQIQVAIAGQALAQRHVTVTKQDLSDARADVAVVGEYSGGAFAQFPRSYQSLLVLRQARLTRLAASLAGSDVSPASVESYAAGHPNELTVACASRILVNTPADAAQVEADLAAGQSFATEWHSKSTDASAQANGGAGPQNPGGQLGCHPTPEYAQLGGAVEQAVANSLMGQPTAPVTGNDGISVFEVTSRQPMPPAVAAAYTRVLLTEQGQSRLGSFIGQRLAAADISVNPVYGTWVPNGQNGPSVTPPAAPQAHSDTPS